MIFCSNKSTPEAQCRSYPFPKRFTNFTNKGFSLFFTIKSTIKKLRTSIGESRGGRGNKRLPLTTPYSPLTTPYSPPYA
jgi:hypothetical protein